MFSFFSKKRQPIPFWFKTDIHCHVVPGVDDGSPDLDTSLQLIDELQAMGISDIITTPHVTDVTFMNNASTLEQPFGQLGDAVARKFPGVRIRMAAENRIDDLLQKNIETRQLITYPNDFVLIENSFVQEPWELESLIFDLSVRGYKPIFAHPERFDYYQNKPERYKTLHNVIPFQVNVLSLAGYYGPDIRKTAEWLIEKNMVDYLGTDCHGMRHIECYREYLSGKSALKHRDALSGIIRNDQDFS